MSEPGGVVAGSRAELSSLLGEVGWSVSRLVHEVNREMGAGYVSRTTASEWVNCSRVPRQPLPTVVAHVLSQAASRVIAANCLWPGVAGSAEWVSADVGTQVSWDLHGMKALINDWLGSGGTVFDGDRRSFMAISGAALTAPAWEYVKSIGAAPLRMSSSGLFGASSFSRGKFTPATMEYFTVLIAAFRKMDDLEGGSTENLRHIREAILQATHYLRVGSFSDAKLPGELLGALAQLSQIAGWMAYDADFHGLAQRHFRVGLQAAHSVGEQNLGAHILACMSYQAVYLGKLEDAKELADAAAKASFKAHPAVRSLVSSRVAYVKACDGNESGFRSAINESKKYLGGSDGKGDFPSYLYWYSPAELDVQCGQSLLTLSLASNKKSSKLVSEAEKLLLSKVASAETDRPRDSLFHSAWLARAHVKRGELHRGLAVAEGAVRRAPAVASARSRKVLGDLDKDLTHLRGDRHLPEVRELRSQLRLALAT
ncbi:MAG: hypothetical protein DLM55_09430 [Acidimicrobiales bacterium]|nr:MAG: hypothetical protein DLM55_09430 [Acidimicrobiales bacterium]